MATVNQQGSPYDYKDRLAMAALAERIAKTQPKAKAIRWYKLAKYYRSRSYVLRGFSKEDFYRADTYLYERIQTD